MKKKPSKTYLLVVVDTRSTMVLITLEADSLNVCFDDPNEVLVHLGVSDLLVLGVA